MRSQLIPLALCGASIATAQRSCNGSPSLCGRLYSNVTFVGAHDSAFVGVLLTDNQYEPLADQMGKGIRFLQAQTHNSSGTIEMCHTTCLERDAGSLASYLAPVKTFLAANPNEVITLLLTNGDAIPVSQFRDAFVAAGLDGYAFAPGSQLAIDQWPTLGSLIDQGKRLVVFMDYHADTSQVPYILDEFDYFFETPFDTTEQNFNQCNIDRPASASAGGRLYLVNHFLDIEIDLLGLKILIPDQTHAADTNSLSTIASKANLCVSNYGRMPNVVLLDFVSVGDAISAQNSMNSL